MSNGSGSGNRGWFSRHLDAIIIGVVVVVAAAWINDQIADTQEQLENLKTDVTALQSALDDAPETIRTTVSEEAEKFNGRADALEVGVGYLVMRKSGTGGAPARWLNEQARPEFLRRMSDETRPLVAGP